jgi:hypothetical protein
VLLHEALGHYGLRGVFGEDLYKVLKQVAGLRRRDIEAKAVQYGLDMGKESDRLIAAEEVLSELAQTNPKSGLVQRAIAAIKKWIRENIPGFENMQLSDSEIIERYLVPARDFVQRGLTGAPGAVAGAFSRNAEALHAINNRVNGQIQQWARGKLRHEVELQLDRPSEILRLFNVLDLPIRLTQSVMSKGRREHKLSASDMRDIALNVQTPITVFESRKGVGHIVLVTEARHAEGNVTVAMQLEVTPKGSHITINDIRTMYPRPDAEVHVWVDAGLLLGYEKRKGRDWLADSGGYNLRRTQDNATLDKAIVSCVPGWTNSRPACAIRSSRLSMNPGSSTMTWRNTCTRCTRLRATRPCARSTRPQPSCKTARTSSPPGATPW